MDGLALVVPELPGLQIVAGYHVAEQERVGGDFYDVIAAPDGCALVVGDACGKGIEAAALAGSVRWALGTLIAGDWSPARAVARLNEVVVGAQARPERYCTVALARLRRRPDGVDLEVVLGGHPHPLVLRVGGPVERVGSTSPIVGWRAGAGYTQSPARLATGDVLLMFTDGLLEVIDGHASSDDTALRALLEPLLGRTARDVADHLNRLLDDSTLADDAAFLVIQAVPGAAA